MDTGDGRNGMFRDFFGRAIEGISRSTPEGRYEAVNPAFARMLGYDSPEQMIREVTDIGRQVYARPEDRERVKAELLSKGEVRDREVELRRRDGGHIWVIFNASAVRDASGAVVAFEGTLVDITERVQVKERLRKIETNLNRAQAVAGVGSWYLDIGSHALEWSAETYRIFGIPGETPMTHEAFLACVHPDDRDLVERSWRAALAGTPYDIEHRIVVGGEIRWVRERAEIECDASGSPLGGVGTVQDITDHRRAEEALHENERHYRLVVENAQEVILIVQEGRIAFANDRLSEVMGFALGELIGEPFTKFLHPEDREFVVEHHRRRLAGEPVPQLYEFRVVTKDGGFRWMEINAVVVTWEGKQATLSFLRDVTDRRRATDELKESKALTEAIVENVPLMVFLKEASDLRFVVFNRAGEELLGYDRASFIGKNDLDLFPAEQAAFFMARDREVLDGAAGVLDIPEEPIQTARRGERLLHTRKVCIQGIDGKTKYLLGISEDITDRRRADEALRVRVSEIEKLNKFMIGREQRVIELKREVNELLVELGREKKFGV